MSAPDRPTREQVDRAVVVGSNRIGPYSVTADAAEVLAAEVRALRAELDALSDEDRAEQIAALIVDKVRAQVARTPQPAALAGARVLHEPYPSMVPPQCRTCVDVDEEPSLWPCATAAALGADPSSPYVAPWGAPLPAVPEGEDAASQPAEFAALSLHWSPTAGLLWWNRGTNVTVDVDQDEVVEHGLALPADALELGVLPWQEHRDGPIEHAPHFTQLAGEDVPARLDAAAAAIAEHNPYSCADGDLRGIAESLRLSSPEMRAAVAAALARQTEQK